MNLMGKAFQYGVILLKVISLAPFLSHLLQGWGRAGGRDCSSVKFKGFYSILWFWVFFFYTFRFIFSGLLGMGVPSEGLLPP